MGRSRIDRGEDHLNPAKMETDVPIVDACRNQITSLAMIAWTTQCLRSSWHRSMGTTAAASPSG